MEIDAVEGERIEFKEAANNSVVKTAAAFANSGDGKVCIGVSDDGESSGWKTLMCSCSK